MAIVDWSKGHLTVDETGRLCPLNVPVLYLKSHGMHSWGERSAGWALFENTAVVLLSMSLKTRRDYM